MPAISTIDISPTIESYCTTHITYLDLPTQCLSRTIGLRNKFKKALEAIEQQESPNIATVAQQFWCPEQRLRARWKGRLPCTAREPTNRKLSSAQELAICQYLDRLDQIGIAARENMLPSAANAFLCRTHSDPNTPPTVIGQHWASRFLKRHPQFIVR